MSRVPADTPLHATSRERVEIATKQLIHLLAEQSARDLRTGTSTIKQETEDED